MMISIFSRNFSIYFFIFLPLLNTCFDFFFFGSLFVWLCFWFLAVRPQAFLTYCYAKDEIVVLFGEVVLGFPFIFLFGFFKLLQSGSIILFF